MRTSTITLLLATFLLVAPHSLAQGPMTGRIVGHEIVVEPINSPECGSRELTTATGSSLTVPIDVSCYGRSMTGSVIMTLPETLPKATVSEDGTRFLLDSSLDVSLDSALTTTAPSVPNWEPFSTSIYSQFWDLSTVPCSDTITGTHDASTTRNESLDFGCSFSSLFRRSSTNDTQVVSVTAFAVGSNQGPTFQIAVTIASVIAFEEDNSLAITPSFAPNTVEKGFFEEPLTVTITGRGFEEGANVEFNDISVERVRFVNSGKLEADLSGFENLGEGERSFDVVNPDGTRITGKNLFYVTSLYIPELEINQAVPATCRSGEPPCVADHDTIVRVPIRCNSLSCAGKNAVEGWLHVFRNGEAVPSSPFQASRPFAVPPIDENLSRHQLKGLEDAMNFDFGESRSLLEGEYDFVFEIDPRDPRTRPRRSSAPDPEVNLVRGIHERRFVESRPTESIHVAILIDGSLHPRLRSRLFAEMNRFSSFVPITYPISRDFVTFDAINDTTVGGFRSESEAFTQLRNWYEAQRQAGSGYSHAILLHQNIVSAGGVSDCMFPWGVQWCSTPTAIIRVDGSEEAVIAHEIGHHYGLGDTYIDGGLEGNNNPWTDDCRFFQDGCPVEQGHVDTERHEMSVAVANSDPAVKSFVKRDIMGHSFRAHRWIDRRSWDFLHARMMPSAGANLLTRAIGDWITVTGTVRSNATGELDGVWYPEEAAETDATVAEDFTVELRDDGGATLRSVDFPATFRYADSRTTQTSMPFSVTLSKPAGAARAVLLHGETELDSISLQSSAPQVSVQSPNGGESLSGTTTIRWQASDPEGDPLAFSVFYEPGDGRRLPLATMISGTELEWNTRESPGADAARVIVMATDGINHVQDSSDGTFSVASGGPVVTIAEPDDLDAVEAGVPVTLRGGAWDFDDGEIPDEDLTFSSSIDGFLGTGSKVTTILSPGSHQITLTATNSSGASASDSIAMTAYTPVSIRRVLPAVGSVQGNLGSFFKTSVQLHNPTDGTIAGRFVFHAAGVSGAPNDPSMGFSLAPGETIHYPDLLPTMSRSGLGSVDLVTTFGTPPVSVVRIFNDAGEAGTAGMTEPQIDPANVLVAGDQSVLILPADPEQTRFNLGIRTLDEGASFYPTLIGSDGTLRRGLGLKSYPPNYFVQFAASSWFEGLTFEGTDVLRINVAEGSLILYGASTDNTTQDPSLQFATAQPSLGAQGESKLIPVVGSLPGSLGSYYRTELQLHNAQNRAVRVRIDYREAGSSSITGSMELDLQNGRSHYIDDLLPAIGIDSGIGSAEITATSSRGGLPATLVRIFNDAGEDGTTGMTEVPLAPSQALGPGQSGVLLAPPEPNRARFNIGLRTLGSGCSMSITVRSSDGEARGTIAKSFPANFFQQVDAGSFLGLTLLPNDSLTFTINTGNAIVYGATSDNTTQDPSLQYAN